MSKILDAIADEAENIALEQYKKTFNKLTKNEQDTCWVIAENRVLGI